MILFISTLGPAAAQESERETFMRAWDAARKGDHATFNQLGPSLMDYQLYPYWQYEYFRYRRGVESPAAMAAFLEQHQDWAFASGLNTAWLKALGERKKWQALIDYGEDSDNTEVRCYRTRAQLALGYTEGLLQTVQSLWTAGRSQPDACDPLFDWLLKQNGVTTELAWDRIELAMQAGNPRFTLYLARFLPPADRKLLDSWQQLNRHKYRNLERIKSWSNTPQAASIAALSLKRLANYDAAAAMQDFDQLQGHFDWDPFTRGDVLREIALMSAVSLEPAGFDFMQRVPQDHRNAQLLEWWARLSIAHGRWQQALSAIDQMAEETANDSRWQYWQARAKLELGQVDEANKEMVSLATRANFHGFLAADYLQLPYTICPQEPAVGADDVTALRNQSDFSRALELREVDLDNWSLSEWSMATRRLPVERLKVAAAVAREEGWYDRAIFALGNSGELSFYEWRFPLLFQQDVTQQAAKHNLDPAWVLGVMRAESAMTESARSSAGALGLMQVTPGTAKTISRKHGLPYQSSSQLLKGDQNIRFGTVYMRELLDDYEQNPVLVSGAYNAGPGAVNRWLNSRPENEAAIWIETLPYYETRDYIPRVLAFTTIYDWRLNGSVQRVSSRMQDVKSGKMKPPQSTQVVCAAKPADLAFLNN